MSIVSDTELVDYMSGIGLDVDQMSAAQDILDGLQRQLERYIQRPLEVATFTETVWPDEKGAFWPKNTPVIEVTAPVDPNTGAVLYQANGNNIAGVSGAVLYQFGWQSPVTFTYTAGIDGASEPDIKTAILRAAAREVAYRHDDVLDVNDLSARSTTPPDKRDPGFSDAELAQFDRLRRRTVV